MDATVPGKRGDATELYQKITSNRISEVIVARVRTLIRTDRLHPGDRLPSERSLSEMFGVSRVTVREALRVLEAGGFVEIRVGSRGGAFVTEPSSTKVGTGLADLVNLSRLTSVEITEARQVIELGIIPAVVERATEADIAELRELVSAHRVALRVGKFDLSMSAAFHIRIAACTHNSAVEMLVRSFHGPLLMSLREAQVVAPRMAHRGTRDHGDLVDAVAARDTEQATAIMGSHLQRTAQRVARRDAARLGRAPG